MSYYYFECPKCSDEITAEVDLGEKLVDFEEQCPKCGYKFTQEEIIKIYDAALEDSFSSMVDYVHDTMKDR